MSMAHGVEVRVPLLDQDLVALAARLPDGMKQGGRTGRVDRVHSVKASIASVGRREGREKREGRIDAAYTIFAVVCIEVWCRKFIG